MEFVDWRNVPDKDKLQADSIRPTPREEKRSSNYIEELIQEAQRRGDFDNLPGMGKPINLKDHFAAGENALAYGLLKSNGFAPPEIELLKEIDEQRARIEARLTRLCHQSKTLRHRRIAPFASEKRAFNHSVEKASHDYAQALRDLNRRILTLNISAPATLHRPPLDVAALLKQFQQACPLFVL